MERSILSVRSPTVREGPWRHESDAALPHGRASDSNRRSSSSRIFAPLSLSQDFTLHFLQQFRHLFPRNGWEVFKKLTHRFSTFNVVEEGLNGHAGSLKDGRSA